MIRSDYNASGTHPRSQLLKDRLLYVSAFLLFVIQLTTCRTSLWTCHPHSAYPSCRRRKAEPYQQQRQRSCDRCYYHHHWLRGQHCPRSQRNYCCSFSVGRIDPSLLQYPPYLCHSPRFPQSHPTSASLPLRQNTGVTPPPHPLPPTLPALRRKPRTSPNMTWMATST